VVPKALRHASTTSPAPSPSTPSPTGTVAPPAQANPGASAEVTPALREAFDKLDCSEPEQVRQRLREPGADDPDKPLVTCDEEGVEKFVLGPAEVLGTDVSSASAGLEQNSQGFTTGGWEVQLDFTGEGKRKFADITRRLAAQTGDLNRFGIVLDGLVVSAPTTNEPITGGQARITGNFSQAEAESLANVLKYGALPLTFDPGEVQEVSATLGGDQLTAGLVAGAIGLFLVVVYSLLYYRGLGLVTVASLAVAAVITYGMVVLLGWQIGFRLSLAGIAGLIVAIGITADSFVVYFERIRDEVREGNTLRVAVESGWVRARRTILAADFVSFLAAVVLYILSVGGVRGFAFTLGLTTLIDVFVVFLFTKPLVSLLARTRFYGQGHRLSGLDPERLGATRRTLLTRPPRRGAPTPKEA
jgi:preprotein translocase subunit SecD